MKILILSLTPWSDDNSFGNSISNIFNEMSGLEFANIYCCTGEPKNKFKVRYYQITEKSLIRNLVNKCNPSGNEILPQSTESEKLTIKEQRIFNLARLLRWQILFWIRDSIWKMGRWDSPELRKFIDEFKPDLIFQYVYYFGYMNDIALFLKDYTNKPMIGYITDDNYTLKCFRFSPLFWIDRLIKRKKVKEVIDKCELLYVISEIQKREYEEIFNVPIKILTKNVDTKCEPLWKEKRENGPIQLLFTGNISGNRWKTLAILVDVLCELNREKIVVQLSIYTVSPISNKMKKRLNVTKVSQLMLPVSPKKVKQLQQNADILVHVEGLDLGSKMMVHQSFSTKLVDYFASGRPVLAIGTNDMASIEHLTRNDCAFVAKNKEEVRKSVIDILENFEDCQKVAKRAWECACTYHSKEVLQKMLLDDMLKLTEV